MSENLNLVRSIYADWEHGDFTSVEWAHPDIELVWADGPEPGRWTGLADVSARWRDFASAWEHYHIEADEFRELGDERVLVLTRVGGKGKTSGLDLTQMGTAGANLFDLRDGKVMRYVSYYDRERALADLGLAPEAS
ncbi:MAG TPA: nuclear transport factor 2 family protein [Solirubrobacteraceae bacterium]|jgi:ketosteroid isomerase-like protein|nr:nuclear transport factor 2 family protein [Solirubrobacteraceae bacterium]